MKLPKFDDKDYIKSKINIILTNINYKNKIFFNIIIFHFEFEKMDKKSKEKIRLNIPKSMSRNKDNKDTSKYKKLIPVNISNRNESFFGREGMGTNTIFINDIETLNESSSFLNNLESFSIKDGFKDSLSIIQSPQGSKLGSNSQRNDNEKFKENIFQKLKDELVIKEKENILLKNEINELRSNIKSMKDKESSNESKILNLNENIKKLERESLNAKNEYQLKEKKLLEEIEQLKNEVKNKEKIINMLQEKVINKSQIIKNLNDLINEKNIKINELYKNFEKNYLNHSRKNFESTKINNKNFSFSGQNKENDNYNKINSIKNCNNKLSIYKNSQKKVSLNQYLKQYNFSTKPKRKILFPKRENQSMTNIFQLNQTRNSETYHDQGPPLYVNNNSKKDFQKKLKKTMNLKKQLNANNKEIFKLKQMKNKINTYENMNNSMKNKINVQNRNNLTHFSNISFHSYSNRVAELTSSQEFGDIKKIINSSHINLAKERNLQDAFLRRLNKNNQKFIKTSFGDTTNSYINIDRTESEKNNKKFINNSLENVSNLGKMKNSYFKNNIGANKDNLFRINDLNKVNKLFKIRFSNKKELNNQNKEYIKSFSNEMKYS